MKRFAEDTKEYAKEREWWEGIPKVREKAEKPMEKEAEKRAKFMTKEEKKAKKKERKRRKRRNSSSSSSSDQEKEARKRAKMDQLRKERLAREKMEQARANKLLVGPTKEEPNSSKKQEFGVEMDRQRKYNSQFNPELSRQ